MSRFALIDTETTFFDELMSVGVLIINSDSYCEEECYYGIITPECTHPAMYSDVLRDGRARIDNESSRADILQDVKDMLTRHGVEHIAAYNASFDARHLPELSSYTWIDILKTAAYVQYNPFLSADCDCCATGKIRSGYSVEEMLGIVSGRCNYEVHNALCDCYDELAIMKFMELPFSRYIENDGKETRQRTLDYQAYRNRYV